MVDGKQPWATTRDAGDPGRSGRRRGAVAQPSALTKNIGRLFIALTYALPEQARELARDVLLDVIDSPATSPEDKAYWRIVLGIETPDAEALLSLRAATPLNHAPLF
jgi:hypothetical protein